MIYNNFEAAALLRTRLKPYLHIEPPMPQSNFSHTLNSIEEDTAKKATVNAFFPRFGFEGSYDKWELEVEFWFLIAK